ncbi:MAG: hypothetical protein ABI881_13035 [Betaproteobacteria bacterium]
MKTDYQYKHEFDALSEEFARLRNECIRLHPHIQDSQHVLRTERDALWKHWLALALKMETLINHTCGSCTVEEAQHSIHARYADMSSHR